MRIKEFLSRFVGKHSIFEASISWSHILQDEVEVQLKGENTLTLNSFLSKERPEVLEHMQGMSFTLLYEDTSISFTEITFLEDASGKITGIEYIVAGSWFWSNFTAKRIDDEE